MEDKDRFTLDENISISSKENYTFILSKAIELLNNQKERHFFPLPAEWKNWELPKLGVITEFTTAEHPHRDSISYKYSFIFNEKEVIKDPLSYPSSRCIVQFSGIRKNFSENYKENFDLKYPFLKIPFNTNKCESWDVISKIPNLSEEFIIEHSDKLNLSLIFFLQKMSFIYLLKGKKYNYYIQKNHNISNNLKLKLGLKVFVFRTNCGDSKRTIYIDINHKIKIGCSYYAQEEAIEAIIKKYHKPSKRKIGSDYIRKVKECFLEYSFYLKENNDEKNM